MDIVEFEDAGHRLFELNCKRLRHFDNKFDNHFSKLFGFDVMIFGIIGNHLSRTLVLALLQCAWKALPLQ